MFPSRVAVIAVASADPEGVLRRYIAGAVAGVWIIQAILGMIPPVGYEPSMLVHTMMLAVAGWLFAPSAIRRATQREDGARNDR